MRKASLGAGACLALAVAMAPVAAQAAHEWTIVQLIEWKTGEQEESQSPLTMKTRAECNVRLKSIEVPRVIPSGVFALPGGGTNPPGTVLKAWCALYKSTKREF